MSTPEHVPQRPEWTCRVCADEWPCQPARDALSAEYADPIPALAIYLSLCLHDAARDLPDIAPADLYRRFLAWLDHPLGPWCAMLPRPRG